MEHISAPLLGILTLRLPNRASGAALRPPCIGERESVLDTLLKCCAAAPEAWNRGASSSHNPSSLLVVNFLSRAWDDAAPGWLTV